MKSYIKKIYRLISRRWFLLCAALVLIGLAMIPYMLQWLMVYETPMKPAEAVFVQVGLGNMLDAAEALYQEGMVKKIVITYDKPRPILHQGESVFLHELSIQQLIERGIPETALHSLHLNRDSKVENRMQLRNWVLANRIQSYLRFASTYHSRYAKMMHDDTFPEGDVEMVVYSSGVLRIWRQHLLTIHNTLIRMMWWKWVSAPQLRMRIEASV